MTHYFPVLINIIAKASVTLALMLIIHALYKKINSLIEISLSIKDKETQLGYTKISQLIQTLEIKKSESDTLDSKIKSIIDSEKTLIENQKNQKISQIISIKNQKTSSIKSYCQNLRLQSSIAFKKSIQISVVSKLQNL